MKLFTIHLRRDGLDPERDVAVVKEGFSWPAFFFGALWAFWSRLWLAGCQLLAATAAANFLSQALISGRLGQSAVAAGVAVVTGLVANDLRRWTLERADFRFAGVAAGRTAEEALLRFFDDDPVAAEGAVP